MGRTVLSMRVDTLFRENLLVEAKRRGFNTSQFVQECCNKVMFEKTSLNLSSEVKNQVELVYQLVLYNPSWAESKSLIEKEVEFLWTLINGNVPYLKP